MSGPEKRADDPAHKMIATTKTAAAQCVGVLVGFVALVLLVVLSAAFCRG